MLSPPRRPPSRTRSVTRSSHTLRRAVSGGADRSVRAHPRLRTRLMPLRVDRHARTSLCSGSRQTRPKKPCCCLELWLEPSALENVARTVGAISGQPICNNALLSRHLPLGVQFYSPLYFYRRRRPRARETPWMGLLPAFVRCSLDTSAKAHLGSRSSPCDGAGKQRLSKLKHADI